jgi:molecular chaperone DnaK
VHSVKKSVAEYGDKVGAEDKAKIEAAVKDAEELLKQNDATKEQLEAKAEELAKTSQKLGEVMYAQAQAAAGAAAGGQGGGAGGESAGGGQHGEEKVVDAEFTEVKDQK